MNNSMKEAEDYINQIPLFGPHTEEEINQEMRT